MYKFPIDLSVHISTLSIYVRPYLSLLKTPRGGLGCDSELQLPASARLESDVFKSSYPFTTRPGPLTTHHRARSRPDESNHPRQFLKKRS